MKIFFYTPAPGVASDPSHSTVPVPVCTVSPTVMQDTSLVCNLTVTSSAKSCSHASSITPVASITTGSITSANSITTVHNPTVVKVASEASEAAGLDASAAAENERQTVASVPNADHSNPDATTGMKCCGMLG